MRLCFYLLIKITSWPISSGARANDKQAFSALLHREEPKNSETQSVVSKGKNLNGEESRTRPRVPSSQNSGSLLAKVGHFSLELTMFLVFFPISESLQLGQEDEKNTVGHPQGGRACFQLHPWKVTWFCFSLFAKSSLQPVSEYKH